MGYILQPIACMRYFMFLTSNTLELIYGNGAPGGVEILTFKAGFESVAVSVIFFFDF